MTEAEMKSATALEDVCRYLAACYCEPDPAFEEERMFESLAEAAALADARLVPHAERLAAAFRAATLDELLLDYTRLFLGPVRALATPYGSYWLEETKTLMGESTAKVVELYRQAEFDVDEALPDLPDHVAVELEFLYLLLFRQHEAAQARDEAKARALNALEQRFLREHLGAWFGKFAAAVEAGAATDFYRQLAQATKDLIGLRQTRADSGGSRS